MWEVLKEWGVGHLIPVFEYYNLDPHSVAKDINLFDQYVRNVDELCVLKINFGKWYKSFSGEKEPNASFEMMTSLPHTNATETYEQNVITPHNNNITQTNEQSVITPHNNNVTETNEERINDDYSEIEGSLLVANCLLQSNFRDPISDIASDTCEENENSPVVDNNIINEMLIIQKNVTNGSSTVHNIDEQYSNSEKTVTHDSNDNRDENEEYIDDLEKDNIENPTNNSNDTNNCTDNINANPSTSIPRVLIHDTPLMLYKFLSEDQYGKGIINAFKNDAVTNNIRNLLVRRVIYLVIDNYLKKAPPDKTPPMLTLTSDDFKALAEEITSVFPTETIGSYFISFDADDKGKSGPGGKLAAHFYYEIGVLHKKGVVNLKKKRPNSEDPEELSEDSSDESDENLDAALATLKNPNDTSFETILNCWRSSFKYRRNLLMEKSFSVSEYLNTFPCLTVNTGAQLIRSDFVKLYPNNGGNFTQTWDTVKEKIKKLLWTTRQPKNLTNNALAQNLRHIEKGDQDAIIVHLLTTLMISPYMTILPTDPSPSVPKKRKITKRRVSSLEARDSIFLIVPNVGCVEKAIEDRQEYLKKNNLPFQPIAVFVGELEKVVDAYVYIENKRYRTKNVFNAIDLTFKSFFAFDCKYPDASCHVWTFLQKIIYGINIKGEFNSPSLQTLINDLVNV